VVQSLVDDSLVHVDKIGTSNWYWAFPGEVHPQPPTLHNLPLTLRPQPSTLHPKL
jgi:hypothetical protein